MQIDLVQQPSDTRDMLAFTLELTYACKVKEFDRLEDLAAAVDAGGLDRSLKILDCPSGIPEVPTLVRISQGSPLLIIHENTKVRIPSIMGGCKVVDRDRMPDSLLSAINSLIEDKTIVMAASDERLVRLRLELLQDMKSLSGDLYIRLSESKYVRILKEGDVFEPADLQKYRAKGVQFLYMRSQDCEGFVEQYKQNIQKILQKNNPSFEAVSRTSESVHEMVRALSKSVGFSPAVQDLVKIQVMATVKLIEKNKKLSDILKKIDELSGSYLGSHSHLTAFLSCGIASQMQWGSENTFLKLNLAAFLHDITLDNEKLAAESSWSAVEQSPDYTFEEKEAFRNHPFRAGEIARQFSSVPPDVDMIVSQHHEMPDGSGFPRGTSSMYLAPLTTVFIIAHEMAKHIIQSGGKFDHDKFIGEASSRYKSSAFKQVLNVVENMRYHTKK